MRRSVAWPTFLAARRGLRASRQVTPSASSSAASKILALTSISLLGKSLEFVGGYGNDIDIQEAGIGRRPLIKDAHPGAIFSLAAWTMDCFPPSEVIKPVSFILASGGHDRMARIWQICCHTSGDNNEKDSASSSSSSSSSSSPSFHCSLMHTLGPHTGWVRACLPVKDLGLLFTVGCNFIKIWSMDDDFRHLGDLRVNRDILCLAAGPVAGGEDRSLRFVLFAGLADGTIVMWELPSPSEEANNTQNLRRFVPNHEAGRIKPHSSRVVSLDFDPATATLKSKSYDGDVVVTVFDDRLEGKGVSG